MELERDLVVQVGITVAVVSVFIVALAVLSTAYGGDVSVDDRSLDGTINGNYEGEVQDGEVSLTFDGTYDNSIEAMLDGTITGTVQNGTLAEATFSGEISGAIDGNASGTVTSVNLDQESRSIEGEFDGTASGTTANDLTAQGGILLLGLMAAFVVGMPAFGYLIQRLKSDDED
jgi:hypothetical protein